MTKQELRKLIRLKKKSFTHQQLQAMSEAVCVSVQRLNEWKRCGTVLLYYPLPDEADTAHLIYIARQQGKRVLLPKVIGERLELRVYTGEESLVPGAYGIMEPVSEIFPEDKYCEIGLAIVPGMAFTHSGARLGRGKGYYDRLLPMLRNAHKAGVCFPFQILEDIPSEPHDIMMDTVTDGRDLDI